MQDRLYAFERVNNFRDFGGYDAADGKLPRGVLFRSASFHDATPADIARLDALGVRFLVDLRLNQERTHEPNRWPGAACQTISRDEESALGLPPHLVALMQEDVSPDSIRTYMKGAYRGFPFNPRHVQLFRAWFAELAKGGPAVVHCAAGKDRTGTLCALTLHALGVDRDTIVADYELTNQAMDPIARLPRIIAHMEGRVGRRIDPEALKPMLSVHADYLNAGLEEITTHHGSLDGYLEEVLGVGAAERMALRRKVIV